MASIANLLVSMSANFGSTTSQLSSLVAGLKGVSGAAGPAHAGMQQLGHGATEAEGGIEKLKEMFSDLGKELIKFGAETLALTSVFEVFKESIEVAAQIESVGVAMEVFTGSAEEAHETIEKLEEVAKSEALNFPQILPAAQHMMALGFSSEQVISSMKAAGNASWALGTPLESVSQRMAMMAMSGMANNRMLRSLGISAKELGAVMDVAGDDVSKAFKGMSEESRLEALMEAMEKFKDVASKEAETVSGKWIEVKNTWHEAFGSMGASMEPATLFLENFAIDAANVAKEVIADLRAIGAEFPILAHLVVTTGQIMTDSLKLIGDALSNDKNIDALKILIEAQRLNISYAEASKRAHAAAFMGPAASKEDKDRADKLDEDRKKQEAHDKMLADSMKSMGPVRAKEAAAGILAQIANEERANTEYAALQRQRVGMAIDASHAIMTAQIDAIQNPIERARAAAAEEVRVAEARKNRIGAIDQEEHDKRNILLQRKIAPEIAAKYAPGPTGEPDKAKAAADALDVHLKVAGEIAKSNSDLTMKQIKGVEAVGKAAQKEFILPAEQLRKLTDIWNNEMLRGFDTIDKEAKATQDAVNKATEKRIPVDVESQKRGTTDVAQAAKSQEITRAQMELERAYGMQIFATAAQRIAYERQLGELAEAQLQLKVAGLTTDVADAQAMYDATGTAEDQNKLNQLKLDLINAQNDALNRQYENATKNLEAIQKENLQYQLRESFVRAAKAAPGALGGAIATGVFDAGGKQGADIGKQVGDALKHIGKQLFGEALTKVIEKLIAEMAANTIIQQLLSWFGLTVQTPNIVANTTALGVLTAAIITQTALLGFAEGGSPPVGVPSIVGEKGPELFIPKESGQIIPAGKFGDVGRNSIAVPDIGGMLKQMSYAGSAPAMGTSALQTLTKISSSSTSSTSAATFGDIHLHGIQNVRDMMKGISDYAKNANPKFSPFAR